ncbi:MAG: T9SS type A sorting domain-containing protein [Bacteroidales bacterium]|nr:T9SS type A sorting domain-containing protein [Bacteroidales bacterium]
MKKRFTFIALILSALSINGIAQEASIHALPNENGAYVMKVSDNGLWAAGYGYDEDDNYNYGRIWNLSTYEAIDCGDGSNRTAIFDITDDGLMAVGSINDRPAYYFVETGTWVELPMPENTMIGMVEAVSADGSVMVGRCMDDYWAHCVATVWKNEQLVDVGVPTQDHLGEPANFNEMIEVSSDGEILMGCLDYTILPDRTAFVIVGDEAANCFGQEHYYNPDGTLNWTFYDALRMSPNGKYVSGAVSWDNTAYGGDSWNAPFVYDVENDEVTLYLDQQESAIFAVDNYGGFYAINPLTFPFRTAYLFKDGAWISMSSYVAQEFGVSPSDIGIGDFATVMSCSSDGKTIVGFDGASSYVLQLPYNIYQGDDAVSESEESSLQVQNPFKDELTLSNLEGLNKIELINLNGVVVKQADKLNSTATLSTGDLPSGIYFLRAYFGNKMCIKKLVKE